MAKVVITKREKRVRLMNPAEKAKKYAYELKQGSHFTNFGGQKTTKGGKPKRLSDTERSWRGGYLQARKDSAKAFKHNRKKGR